MTRDDLDQRADLTIWPRREPVHTAPTQSFRTLREALRAAAAALTTSETNPWIITERGDVLSPAWIRANAPALA